MKWKFFILFQLFYSLSFAQNQPKIGLVLSGGGAKGYAHVAVIKAIEDANLKIDYVSGTSMGAIIGSLYAAGYNSDQLKEIIYSTDFTALLLNNKDRKFTPLFDKTYNERYILDIPINNFKISLPNAISKGENALLFLSELLNNQHNITDFSKLPIPFICVATDLETGKEKVFERGFLPKAVMASAALPSLLNPVEIDGKIYIDGGLVDNLPAKILKDKGMDVIIGVNLGQGLKNMEEINGIQNVLEQISNFSIIKGVDKQLKYIDILINPDLKNYSVTSFSAKDSIIAKGKIEVEKYKSKFDSLSKLQTLKSSVKFDKIDEFCINEIDIEGKDNYNSDYIKGKLGVFENETTTSQKITNGLKKLYSTGNFKTVDYQLIKDEYSYDLKLNLVEDKTKLLGRLGVHYDDVFKSGLLLNLTLKNFIFNNTSASLDVVVGDKPRYFLKIFSDNGIKPSIGFNSSYYNFPLKNAYDNSFNLVDYNLSFLNNTFYIQSTLKEKYAVAVGIDHDNIVVKSKNLNRNNPNYQLENSFYISPKAMLVVDTQNNPNFPTNGLLFNALGKYLWLSNQDDFRRSIHINSQATFSFNILKNLSLTQSLSFGTSIDNFSNYYNNFLGGFNKQDLLFFDSFYGYEFSSINNEHKIKIATTLQFKVYKNNYIQLFGNIANLEKEFVDLQYFKYNYSGFGIGYGYDSPLGPIHINYSYSPEVKENIINFSIGYWF